MGFVHFPAHLLGHRPDAPTPSFSWSRLTIYGLCIALYSGIESAFGGWITEFARRSTANPASLRWETAASAFWGGLAAGRGLVAVVLRQRFETAALFGGLGIVAAALTSLIVMSSSPPVFVVAVACGLGMAPSFPVTMASLSRKVPPRVGQPMIALGSLGAAVVPWIVGAISTRTGSLASGLSALVGLLAVLVGLQVMRVSVSRQSSVVSRQS
jgi:fucose permease